MPDGTRHLLDILKKNEASLLADWIAEQSNAMGERNDLIKAGEVKTQCKELLGLLRQAVQTGSLDDIEGTAWEPVREMLSDISRSRAIQGFAPSETATFIFSLKKPLFNQLQEEFRKDPAVLAEELWTATTLLDKLGLYSTEIAQKSRDEIISRQQQELLELSTPVIKLWDGILTVPIIGTLDSMRTQIVMEALLQMIVDTGSELAIIDITGVPTVDTLTAQHLLKTVAAARLMGAECIISGIRPQIAQTIVHLGVDLAGITTKASLAEAFRIALQRQGVTITRIQAKV